TGGGASVSKQSNPYSGIQCLRITGAAGYTYPAVINTTVGRLYHVRGKMRSDGTSIPVFMDATLGAPFWTGTNSTSWQDINIIITANGTRTPILYCSGGTYIE